MNKAFKWSIALFSVMAMGCAEDEILKNPVGDPAYSGDDVVFTFVNQDNKSRTTYAEPWAEEESQNIYWGNYIADQVEQIKIYCRESDGNMAVYNVNPNTNPGSSTAISIGKAEENTSIRWGAQYTDRNYEFYSFYPAASAGNAFVGNEGHVIQASVETGQVPRAYKYKVGDGELAASTLEEIAKANGIDASKRATIFAMPDMESAIMTAHTSVAGTPDKENGTGYGYPVPLDFKVIADVLDITVNGPITPNTLGGNANPDGTGGVSQNYIKIRSITIESKSKKTLSGKFTIDMDNGTVTPIEGNSRILVTTSDEGQYPTLHVRSTDSKIVDQLRLRVFLMPGQVTDLSDLTVTVDTDCGDYAVDLQVHEMVSGAIHPIKLNYFMKRGKSFDFKQWIGQLAPNIYLSELSIPGSWHSSNPNAQGTAATDLNAQYAAGIRAFEVHTTNGTRLYTDYHFTTELTNENATYLTTPLNTTVKQNDRSFSGGTFSPATSATGQSNRTRQVTATDVTVTVIATKTDDYKANYALRLYRTARGVTEGNSLSEAVMSLATNMNSTGFMMLEFGMNGQNQVPNVPVKQVVNNGVTGTISGITLTGTQNYSDRNYEFPSYKYSFDAPTFTNVTWTKATYNGKEINLADLYTLIADDAWNGGTAETPSYYTISVDGAEAWTVAVQSCLNRLAETDFTTKDGVTHKILYTDRITPETTIADVRGHVIVKVNTNYDINDNNVVTVNNEVGWIGNQIPALFSRWKGDSAKEPRTINMKWGTPVHPTPLDEGPSDLHWCYTEVDNITGNATNTERIAALTAFANISYKNYEEGLHRTFYECAIGGFLNNSDTETGYQDAAKLLNPALLNILTDPTRKPSPMGIVFMNYVIPPTDETDAEATYKSAELIRTIINNNAAFMLQRRSETSSANAADKTNSSFSANNGNPLK